MGADASGAAAGRWQEIREATLLHEDADVLALNKPEGLAVVGDNVADDIVRLAAAAGETLRPVHRIDKVTSGLIVFARTAAAHAALTRQFAAQTVEKTYLCVVEGTGLPERGTIALPLATGRKNTVRVAAQREAIRHDAARQVWSVAPADVRARGTVYPAETRFTRLWQGHGRALLAVRPLTGRRHQIRVHLAWIGHAVAGDPLFAPKSAAPGRTLLHAWRLAFDAVDGSGTRVTLEAPPDDGFREAIPMEADAFAEALEAARA